MHFLETMYLLKQKTALHSEQSQEKSLFFKQRVKAQGANCD